MPFVERFAGAIVGEFARSQPQAIQFVAEGDAELLAFRAGLLPGSAGKLPGERAAAKAIQNAPEPLAKLVRAVVLVMLDEINLVRAKLVPPLAARTAAQLKAAIAAKLDGAAD